ncbi:hypothetical protein KPH14_009038 [Odynerus spinipes]|uniref:Uncharacterized protein n=1 Tax=Odynerus spinipes TaxID=1348599 RepID=A0AAD9VR49_9HYME|nr:hypothetical protein KPH14_009038 [Odynerus spinipes]
MYAVSENRLQRERPIQWDWTEDKGLIEATEGEDAEGDPSATQANIEYLEPNMEIVESMHRVYAVPSEKLRIWSVWLSLVSEEAETWQKWLRAHIHLVLRMSEHLKELEDEGKEKPSRTGEQVRRIFAYEEDAITDDGIEYPRGVEDFYDIEKVLASVVSGEMESVQPSSTEASYGEGEEQPSASEYDPLTDVDEGPEGEENRMSGGADQSEDEGADDFDEDEAEDEEEGEGIDEEEEEEEADYLKEWPLGTEWEPFGIQEEEDHSDIVEKLEMPETPEEMKQLIKDFTYTATVYRSYFKHWQETSERAIKEIVGRTVLPTAKLRGILDENDVEGSLRACLGYPEGAFRKSDACFEPPGRIARLMALSERIGTVEFIKEMARADEDIPYFFYLTAEPDIDIAIKHDDEEVILADPDVEVISSKYGRVRFNLADKPGKGRRCSVGNG